MKPTHILTEQAATDGGDIDRQFGEIFSELISAASSASTDVATLAALSNQLGFIRDEIDSRIRFGQMRDHRYCARKRLEVAR